MRCLLDTCVVSELISRRPNPLVVRWIDSVDEDQTFLSAITIGELQRGVARLPGSKRKRTLTIWLADDLLVRYQGRILPVDVDIMLVWGNMVADLDARGRPLPAMDSLLASQALQRGLQLVTRNESDFIDTGVSLFNPWRS